MTGGGGLSKLPPHVVRELRRHLPPPPSSAAAASGAASQQQASSSSSSSNNSTSKKVLAGCLALTATAASFPLVAHWWMGRRDGLAKKDAALTAPQIRRGAFLNSGSRDVGRDPNWDFAQGQYKKDDGYYAIFQQDQQDKQQKKQRPGVFADAAQLDAKHQAEMEAFARGQGQNNRRN